jgi:hypothetical protein
MFGFFRRSQPHHPSAGLSQALVEAGRASGTAVAELRVLERRGTYSDRRVTYFRAFDPAALAARAVTAATYTDLDSYPELVVAAGHLERDGAVVLNRAYRPSVAAPGPC